MVMHQVIMMQLQLGKFPICNFQNDMYTNWLTQNSINVLGQTITSDDMNIAGNVLGAGIRCCNKYW